MKKLNSLLLTTTLFLGVSNSFAQLSIPLAEDVYGGRINAITAISTTADSSRIFISTESANSLFYADAYVPAGVPPVYGAFKILPGAGASAGLGANIQSISAHQISGNVFFINGGTLSSTKPSSSTVNSVMVGVTAFTIAESTLFTLGNQFTWGALDGSGNFTISSSAPITNPIIGFAMTKIVVNNLDSLVYLFQEGGSPQLYVSSDKYSALTSSSTFTNISPTTLNASYTWVTFGVAPDGRLFIGGRDFTSKYIAYSDNSSTWTEIPTGINGMSGPNLAFTGDSVNYSVYYASAYSDANGTSSWNNFGNLGFETNPNDGAVFTDPNNADVVYMTTDQGIGASHTKGQTIYEINNGVEAVQVKDIDMTSDKNTAWIASKSGIREVTNYQTTPVWTNALFPNGDGSPYYSVAMKPGIPNTVFAGNSRVYKTTDGGTTWAMVFTAENAPYSYNNVGVYVKAIEVCQYNADIIFAGYYAENSAKGGVFYSMDGGTNWNQLLVEASAVGQDVDVRDIVFNVEGTDTVAYIGVEYDLGSPQGKSVYRALKNGSAWTVAQNFDGANTIVGYQITATINDLYKSVTGDTIYACGTDAGLNEPHVYSKSISGTNKWDALAVSGFPFSTGTVGKAITVGNDTIYCAVDNEIYYLPLSASSWTLGYTYPVGNEINFLYFDELLVGAGTGLYSQGVDGLTTGIVKNTAGGNRNKMLVYPNPIKNITTISYTIYSNEHVFLSLVDMMGRKIQTIVNENKAPGTYKATINVEQLAKGVYIVKLISGKNVSVQEVVIE